MKVSTGGALQEQARSTADPVADQGRGAGAGSRGLRRMPGLDGVRALAVGAVVLFHAEVPWMPGGFLGVDVFFVLSGFLITGLLLSDLQRLSRVDFRTFYVHRARRLLPALLLLLAVVAVAAAFVVHDAAATVRTDVLASLGYVANWWFVVQHSSYFDGLGRPPLLQHLWSLSVEEQFYLVWPAAVLLAYRWRRSRGVLLVAVVGAVASTAWMSWVSIRGGYPVPNDPSRAYFGTDTHAMGLLVGAALACGWRAWQPSWVHLTGRGRTALDVVGVIGLAGVLTVFLRVDAYSAALYRGGFLVLALATAALIAAVSHPGTSLSRAFGWGPARWVGERSYGIYLWHWPVFMLTRPGLDLPWTGAWVLAARIGLVVAIAELSYRFVELPVRRGALGRVRRAWATHLGATAWPKATAAGLLTLTTAVVVGSAAVALAHAPAGDTSPLARELQQISAALASSEPTPSPGAAQPAAQLVAGSAAPSRAPAATEPGTAGPTASGQASETSQRMPDNPAADPVLTDQQPAGSVVTQAVTAVGDSVLLGAAPAMQAQFRSISIDARIGRQPDQVFDEVRALNRARRLAATVVVHAGTNGLVTVRDLDALLTDLRSRRRVVLVNTSVDRSWRAYTDRSFASAAPRFANTVLVDWNALSAGHRDWFVSDGVHLTKAGARAFAAAVAAAVQAPAGG